MIPQYVYGIFALEKYMEIGSEVEVLQNSSHTTLILLLIDSLLACISTCICVPVYINNSVDY